MSKLIQLILILFLYIIIIKGKINTKVCLCVIGKKENLYALEFVEHYKNWNKIIYLYIIFIYDNNDIDGERFEEILYNHISNKFVTITNTSLLKYYKITNNTIIAKI